MNPLTLNARLGARSRSLLHRGHIQRILGAKDMQEAFLVFLDTGYASELSLEKEPDLEELDTLLTAGLWETTRVLRDADPHELFAELMMSPMSAVAAFSVLLQQTPESEESEASLSYYPLSQYRSLKSGGQGPARLSFLKKAYAQALELMSQDSSAQIQAQLLIQKAFLMREEVILDELNDPSLRSLIETRRTGDIVRSAVRRREAPIWVMGQHGLRQLSDDALEHYCLRSGFAQQYREGVELKEQGADLTEWEIGFQTDLIKVLKSASLSSPLGPVFAACFFLTKIRNAEIIRVLFSYKSLGFSRDEIESRSANLLSLVPAA